MKRRLFALAAPLSLLSAYACSCGDELPYGPDAGDAAVLPDAHIATPMDAGAVDAMTVMPTVTTVSPSSGSELGGTRVIIRGTSFTEPVQVFFDDQPAASEPVLLDEVSVAATTPPHAPGAVTVKVTTAGGTAELPNGFRYHRELSILAIDPVRVPEEGGVFVTITGRGFDEDTLILFDREPLRGSHLVDAEHIDGYLPALSPGRPEIRAIHRTAEARRSDLLFVYATPEIRALAPGFGPASGRLEQTIAGSGFEDAMRVTIGGALAPDLLLDSGTSLRATSPALPVGVYTVRVENADASGELEGGYVSYDPGRTTFDLIGASPRRVSSAGGDVVTIVGDGIPGDPTVTIGGIAAMVSSLQRPHSLTVMVPAGLSVGPQDIVVSSAVLGASASATGALVVFPPLTLASITPDTGAANGSTNVTITGSGFTSDVEVRVADVPLADVVVVSSTEITGRIVAGAHGPQDVVVKNHDSRAMLHDGFRFTEPFSIIRFDPVEGSIAGNTYVSVFGRGLDLPVSVKFGAIEGVNPVLENGSVIGVRTAPRAAGTVDVTVQTAGGMMQFPAGFTFYDPRLITGGAWGGAIEGDVNVAVLDIGSGNPIQGMVVQLGYGADLRYAAITDQNGLATISSPEIRGPQTITSGQNGVEFVTFMELNAKNLTVYTNPYPMSPPPDAPVQPCPMPQNPPTIRGKIFRFKSSLDEVTRPGFTPIARITYSQAGVFQPNPAMPAEQADFVQADGEEYEIVTTRVGTVAVYAILYDYNPDTQELIPRKMGIARNVPAAIDSVTENINISLDIELNQSLTVRLDHPPAQVPGPTLNAVFPFLNLENDGVIAFPPTAVAFDDVTLPNLPDLAASQYIYMGGSFTSGGGGQLSPPWSLAFLESGDPFEQGLDLGPFLSMPENANPKAGQVLREGRIHWDQAGTTPDITTLSVLDVATVSGCCCIDVNMNGVCEDADPQQCGGLPQFYPRWTVYGQGGLENYVMPSMPPGVNAFDSPREYQYEVNQAIAPRFDYREFVFNELLSPLFWTSWSYWASTFVSKEETP